jgi:hypothetical protein
LQNQNSITVAVSIISCLIGFGMPTYFELFSLGATLFSFKDNQNNNDQKKERSITMKKVNWNAIGVVVLGEAGLF